ncbi:MAG: methyltransferase domain-containing protein [Solirubrobacteraceae bacterium]
MFPLLQPKSPCPACGTRDGQRPLHVYRNKAKRTTDHDELALLGCERCGLAYSHPRPTDAQLQAYYGETHGWEAREGGDDFAAGPQLEDKLAVKRRKYARERDLLAPWLAAPGAPRRTLDFGAGQGAWLDVLADEGWETWGIEPGPAQRALAARRHRMVEELPQDPRFDLVVVNHVFEHLRDPLAVLRSLATALAAGGRLFVSVPDLGRLGEHGRLKYVASDVHICSFTFDGMCSLLGLAGFRVLAHLDGSEWDELAPSEPARLKVLAELDQGPVEPSGRPLDAAVSALRTHARREQQITDVPVSFPLLEPWGSCPVCGADTLEPLHAYKPGSRPLGRSWLALLGCCACGVVHSHPPPPPTVADLRGGEEERSASDAALLRSYLRLPTPAGAVPPRALLLGGGGWTHVLAADGWEITNGYEHGDAPVELAILDNVLGRERDPVGLLRSVSAVLVPDGRLLVCAPDLGRIAEQGRLSFAESDAQLVHLTFSGLSSMLALAGLAVDEHVVGEAPLAPLQVLALKDEAAVPAQSEPLSAATNALRHFAELRERPRAEPSVRDPGARGLVRRALGRIVGQRGSTGSSTRPANASGAGSSGTADHGSQERSSSSE